jgi:hypothetical protein
MKCLLSLCQLVTTSLSPSQETDFKIVMSTVHPFIGYVVDEMVDVDNEIIRQLIKWDYHVSFELDWVIVYCFT